MNKNYDFFSACKNGNVRKIRKCLERGEDINSYFSKRWVSQTTPLLTILKYKKYEALKYLILNSNELDINTLISPDTFLLDYITDILLWKPELSILLIKKGANFFRGHDLPIPPSYEKQKILPLMRNINTLDYYGYNCLMYVIHRTSEVNLVFELLQRKDLDINYKNQDGRTALHYACLCKDTIDIKRFLNTRRDVDVNVGDYLNRTPIFYMGEEDMNNIKILIDAGADIFFKGSYGENFFDMFPENVKEEIIEYYYEVQRRRIKPAINRVFHKTEEEE